MYPVASVCTRPSGAPPYPSCLAPCATSFAGCCKQYGSNHSTLTSGAQSLAPVSCCACTFPRPVCCIARKKVTLMPSSMPYRHCTPQHARPRLNQNLCAPMCSTSTLFLPCVLCVHVLLIVSTVSASSSGRLIAVTAKYHVRTRIPVSILASIRRTHTHTHARTPPQTSHIHATRSPWALFLANMGLTDVILI